ncbi:MAG: DUF4178 domain-containing protein [Deltaproteobacteria bacterium]|nr:DUF4178 domain-containing protein [Deltaproteobacteria bacterium]
MFWIFAGLIIVIGAAALYLWMGGRNEKAGPTMYPGMASLKIHDKVSYLGEVYDVQAILVLNEGGCRWRELLLVSDERKLWLRIESAGPLRLTLLNMAEKALVEGSPPANIVQQDITYRLEEQGTAYLTRYGEIDGVQSGDRLDYFHYLAGKGNRLSIERIENGPYFWRFGREITMEDIDTERDQGE